MTTLTAAQKKAREIRDEINAALGTTTLGLATDEKYRVVYTSTGLLPIDILLSGGMPNGRSILVTGDFSTLKSYIGLKTIESYQKANGVCSVIDTEHSFDEEWAIESGVDPDALLIDRPKTGELAIDLAETMVVNNVDFILFDSIAAALPQAERNKRLHEENQKIAATASLMSIAFRKLTSANDNTAIMWINQLRTNVGVTFGSKDTMNGGKAPGYYASYIINVTKVGKITQDRKRFTGDKWESTKDQTGQRYKATLQKSKLSAPFAEVLFEWDMVNNRIDLVQFMFTQGVELGLITLKGATWTAKVGKRELKVVGKDKFRAALSADTKMQAALEREIRIRYKLPTTGEVAEAPEHSTTGGRRLSKGMAPKKVLRLKK